MLMTLLGALLVASALAGLLTRPFVPMPTMAPLRYALTGLTLVAGGLLLFSLSQDWWVTTAGEPDA